MTLDGETLCQVVDRLVGPIQPAGCTNLDEQRMENLKAMIVLGNHIFQELRGVAECKGSQAHSIAAAGSVASTFLNELKNYLEE